MYVLMMCHIWTIYVIAVKVSEKYVFIIFDTFFKGHCNLSFSSHLIQVKYHTPNDKIVNVVLISTQKMLNISFLF